MDAGLVAARRTEEHGYDGAVRCWSCSEAFNLANAGSIPVRVTEIRLGVMLVLQSGPQPDTFPSNWVRQIGDTVGPTTQYG